MTVAIIHSLLNTADLLKRCSKTLKKGKVCKGEQLRGEKKDSESDSFMSDLSLSMKTKIVP